MYYGRCSLQHFCGCGSASSLNRIVACNQPILNVLFRHPFLLWQVDCADPNGLNIMLSPKHCQNQILPGECGTWLQDLPAMAGFEVE